MAARPRVTVGLPARYPQARWRGPVPNENPRGQLAPLYGLVLHVEEALEASADNWFHSPGAEASAHFGIRKASTLGEPTPPDQWVEIGDRAWAEAAGNSRWLSAETEGHAGDPMDTNQLGQLAMLYAWLHHHDPASFPFHTSDSPTETGFGWHGMGGDAWGGHLGCPGDKRKAQRPIILAKAITLVHPTPAQTRHEPAEPVTPTYPGHVLELGAHGPAVEQLQQHLAARGWSVPVSGDYDHQTAQAVAEFEAEKHLRVDGAAGPVVWWAVWHLPVT